jgi:hypothetical protein
VICLARFEDDSHDHDSRLGALCLVCGTVRRRCENIFECGQVVELTLGISRRGLGGVGRLALFAVSTGASSRLMAALTKIGWPKVTRFLFVPVEIPW